MSKRTLKSDVSTEMKNEVAAIIRGARARSRLSLRELAAKTVPFHPVSAAHANRIEKGETDPSAIDLASLIKALPFTLEERIEMRRLMFGEDAGTTGPFDPTDLRNFCGAVASADYPVSPDEFSFLREMQERFGATLTVDLVNALLVQRKKGSA